MIPDSQGQVHYRYTLPDGRIVSGRIAPTYTHRPRWRWLPDAAMRIPWLRLTSATVEMPVIPPTNTGVMFMYATSYDDEAPLTRRERLVLQLRRRFPALRSVLRI